MSVSLRQLRSLVTLARVGSFTRAAQELNLSQPALTVQMRQLEAVTGVHLLDRNTHFVKLTPLGSQLVPIIERALVDIDVAFAGAKLKGKPIGVVTAAALPSMCFDILPLAIAQFRTRYPEVTVRLLEIGTRRIPSCVAEEEAQLGFGLLDRPNPKLDTTPFITDRLMVVCPMGHPLSDKRTVVPVDLAEFPLIAFDPQYYVRTLLDSTLQSYGSSVPPAYEVNSISTAMGMVRAGLGITVVSSSSVSRVSMTGLRARPIKHPALARGIVVMRKKGRTLSAAAECFLAAAYSIRDQRLLNNSAHARAQKERRRSSRKSGDA